MIGCNYEIYIDENFIENQIGDSNFDKKRFKCQSDKTSYFLWKDEKSGENLVVNEINEYSTIISFRQLCTQLMNIYNTNVEIAAEQALAFGLHIKHPIVLKYYIQIEKTYSVFIENA